MVKPSPLDDRDTSDIAWARYRRLMKGMAIVSFGAVVLALGWLRFTMGGQLTIHMIIATAAGVGLSVMLGAALLYWLGAGRTSVRPVPAVGPAARSDTGVCVAGPTAAPLGHRHHRRRPTPCAAPVPSRRRPTPPRGGPSSVRRTTGAGGPGRLPASWNP